MGSLVVNLENCYGIKKLKHTFEFDEDDENGLHAQLIYAPNGSMKSSFAKVFEDIASGEFPKDRHFPDRDPVCSITHENDDEISPEQILVIQPYDKQHRSDKQSTLMVNLDLKKQHESIHAEIDSKKEQLLGQLKKLGALKTGVRDLDRQLTSAFKWDENDFFSLLEKLEGEVLNDDEPHLNHIAYRQVINPRVVKFLEDPAALNTIQEYIDKYDELISASKYLRKGVFNHNNAITTGKQLAAQGFFKAEHSVLLKGDGEPKEVRRQEDLNEIIEAEKQEILSDPELHNRFTKIDDALSGHADLKNFRDYVTENQDLIPELNDLDRLKRKLWIDYLKSVRSFFQDLMLTYREGKKELKEIETAAQEEATQWENVVKIFKDRFIVPYELKIVNKVDAILRAKMPTLKMTFIEDGERSPVQLSEAEMLSALSTGEERAYYVLHMIFDVQARINDNQETVIVLDDIADSFDYKNKYAIVEYLADIRKTNLFKMIILTHNFDFARTASRRVPVDRRFCYMTNKTAAEVKLVDAHYLGSEPLADFRMSLHTDKKKLIAAIPFVRNLLEYREGTGCDEYKTLTKLLHIKQGTSLLTTTDLESIYNSKINPIETVAFDPEPALELIYREAENASLDNESMNLENKIIWSIATRLKAEEFMIKKIDDELFTNGIDGRQTVRLISEYKNRFRDDPSEARAIGILDRVNLMTAENIHLNSFMIEPLLDLSDDRLKGLYLEVKALNEAVAEDLVEDTKDLAPA